MVKPRNDLLQGTLALLVLKTLARGPLHGYGITLHIQMVSRDFLRVEEEKNWERLTQAVAQVLQFA